jgi:hypothetical protein
MVNYDPFDPSPDPYWEAEKTEDGRLFDSLSMDDLELEELVDDCVREMREAGLLRPTLVKPGEHNLVIEDNPTSAAKGLNGDLPF